MRLEYTERQKQFRAEVREWLAANVPKEPLQSFDLKEGFEQHRAWERKLSERGFSAVTWPRELGGRGCDLIEWLIFEEEYWRAGAPLRVNQNGIFLLAPTLMEYGTPEQKQRFLPRMATAEDTWAQGWSEPGAGSDMAAIRSKAIRTNGHYVINGQKTWSTMAQYADRCLLLVRTDSSGPPQAGLSYLLLDMKSRGVSVRPIAQITGDDEFAEIFFDEVEVPVSDRIGDEGQGWAVAQSTLASERGLTLVELSQRMRYALARIAALMRERGVADDPVLRRDLGRLIPKVDAACALADRYLLKRIDGTEAPGDASIVKLHYARTLREFTLLGQRIAGLAGQYREEFTRGGGMETGNWPFDFMNSYNWSIAGGSDEIQRNIIAERMLGMPREPRNWTLA